MEHNKKGFTLVELVIVVAILGILLSLAINSYKKVTEQSAEAAFESNHLMLVTAVHRYMADHGGQKPNSLSDVLPYVAGIEDDSPPEATYTVTNGDVKSEYPPHRDTSKRELVYIE